MRLGAYEVLSAIGAGGMGEVYRARDTTLNRDVALKILPETFASDPDRLARFKREAQLLASLNHPNIGAIYGVQQSGEVRAGARTHRGAAHSPTITSPPMTRAGVLLGTAAYMSPEQARGLPIDKRTDIWAFGCLLLETLTGRPAFAGATVSDTIARILERDPDWRALPATTPPSVTRLLR